jgi:hypothetical protein
MKGDSIMPDTKYEFPDTFLEAGNDEDHTYASLKTIRQADGCLKIDVIGWGVAETGLYLDIRANMHILELRLKGVCGTVKTRTLAKVSFSYLLDRETENDLHQIGFRHLLLHKLPIASSQ